MLALRSRMLFASIKVMQKPRSYSPQHFDMMDIYQIRAEN